MSLQSTLVVMLADNLLPSIRSSWATRLGHESDTSKGGHERQCLPARVHHNLRPDARDVFKSCTFSRLDTNLTSDSELSLGEIRVSPKR
jgi:hypothetical protein